MKIRVFILVFCIAMVLCGCITEAHPVEDVIENRLISVGFSQVGAESEWRVANTESMKTALSEENGYELIYDDGRNKPENQIRAIRTFIQQDVDYIVFSPIVETGWNSILQEAKEAGIPVIVTDRYIETGDKDLYTAYIGSDFRREGEKAVKWLGNLLFRQGKTKDTINIVHIQGTLGSSAQIGRTAALEQATNQNPNWKIVAQRCGDFTRAKGYEVMTEILREIKDINVVYCENDGEALGAIDAMEEVGLKCNADYGVIVISFDATRLGLQYCLDGKIALNVECNPLQGPYVDEIIREIENGERIMREKYVSEMQFDYLTITQDMIDRRRY